MPEGLPSTVAEAFAQAETEAELANPAETLTDLPLVEEDVIEPDEQVEAQAEVEAPVAVSEENPLDDLLTDEQTQSYWPDPGSDDWWGIGVEVPTGDGTLTVTLDEMRDGYMRQADYTRKTQDVARERGLVNEAAEFYSTFKEDPVGFAKYVASKAGLIDDEAPDRDGVNLFTQDQVEAEVQQRLQQALTEHPDVQAARQSQAVSAVATALNGIEQKYGISLTDDHRILILQEAQAKGTADLELVYEALSARAASIRAGRVAASQSSAARPAAPPRGQAAVVAEPTLPTSVADAWAQAEAELEGAAI